MNIKRHIRDFFCSIPAIIWAGSNFLYTITKRPAAPRLLQPPFLVIVTNGIGDTINTLSAIKRIRDHFPQARIDCLVQPPVVSLLKCVEDINETFSLHKGPFLFSIRKAVSNALQILRLRKRRYQTIITFTSNFYAAWRSFLIGAPKRCGYSRNEKIGFFRVNDFGFLYTDDYKNAVRGINHMQEHLNFVRAMGVSIPLDCEKPSLAINARLVRKAQAFFESKKPFQNVIIIHPFTPQPIKAWPQEKYITLINKLLADDVSYIILTGEKSECCNLFKIKQRCKGRVRVVCDLKLDVFAALISCADLLVGNDSGPMHIASAVGTKAVAIFGPTNPKVILPPEVSVKVLKIKIDCFPCYELGIYERCHLGHHRCMENLRVETVCRAIQDCLDS